MNISQIGGISMRSAAIDQFASRADQLDHLSSELESVFISTLLKQMRQSMGGESFFPGDKSDTLGGLFDMHMSQFIAENGGIGLSESLDSALAPSVSD